MKIGEIIQRIQSIYSKGVQSDDSRLTARHIYNKMLTVRAKLIKQQANKKQKISQWNYQTLPCVELVKASAHECPCLPPIGCKILRTKHPIPKPITDLSKHLIQSVTSIDGSVVYSETSWVEKKYKNSNKYTANKPDYFIKDGYLYITHLKGAEVISIAGVFEDPIEVENFPSYCENDIGTYDDCNSPLEKEFPIDNDMIDTLIEITTRELPMLFSQNIEDLTNDSKDSNIKTAK